MSDDTNDLTVSEQTPEGQYLQVERNKNFPPSFIMDLMMGVSAQRRRAYLLQSKYLTPLTVEYVILTFFFRYTIMCLICSLAVVLWIVVGYANPIIYMMSIVCLISIYIGYQWSVTQNTKTVKEEVLLNAFIGFMSTLFAVYTVFDLSLFFVWITSSPFK